MLKLDMLAIGAHPDDVELAASGVLIKEKLAGKKTGVVDLTEGELGTRGTISTRYEEAALSSKIMGLDCRENLKLADGFFQNDEANQKTVISAIRKYQPEIIFCNAPTDRHPDHGKGFRLVKDAAFLSGLRKVTTFEDGVEQKEWRPKYVFSYIQDQYLQPNFVIDISDVMEQKLEAIKSYKTQFFSGFDDSSGPQTYISTPDFLESIIYRAKMFGKMIGVKYAEGFISEKMIGFPSFDSFIKQNT